MKDLSILDDELLKLLENSYSPYSKYKVSALLQTDKGIFKGVNIENGGIQSICAERVAFSTAISSGAKEFYKIYIVAKKEEADNYDEDVTPCGYCRQFMSEFVNEDFAIIVRTNDIKRPKVYLLKDLLPLSFKK